MPNMACGNAGNNNVYGWENIFFSIKTDNIKRWETGLHTYVVIVENDDDSFGRSQSRNMSNSPICDII